MFTPQEAIKATDNLSRRNSSQNLDDPFELLSALDLGEKYDILMRLKKGMDNTSHQHFSKMKKHFDKCISVRNAVMHGRPLTIDEYAIAFALTSELIKHPTYWPKLSDAHRQYSKDPSSIAETAIQYLDEFAVTETFNNLPFPDYDDTGFFPRSELQAILDGDYSEDQKAHAGCIILVNGPGNIEVTAGLVRPEDKKAAIDAGVLQAPQTTKSDTPKSPYSQKLVADMQAIRLASVQAALLAKPELVLDLLGFGLSEASGSFESVFGIRLDRPTNAPSVEDGFAREPRLEHGIDASEYWQKGTRMEDLSEAFATFRESGKKSRNAQITEAIARTLPYRAGDAEFFAMIADEAGADIRKHWTPTAENFFSQVSAGHLVDLLCEFLDCDARDERVVTFAKLKKAEKAEKMEKLVCDPTSQKLMGVTSEQKAKLDKWVPDCT